MTSELAAVTAAAQLLEPLLPVERRGVISEAVARARQGRPRVLVLGEAKRGKSTLVNALFGAALLPTGALPLTSVATVVAVGTVPDWQVRYLDGHSETVDASEVAGLVSERGNPSNERHVDRVLITAPCLVLPEGTEVVDTPGTGSVHTANTDEAQRARVTLDLAVLVVSADPPVAAAELDLLTDAMAVASRAAVVINKADLLSATELADVVDFTAQVVGTRLGRAVPVFALSALASRRRDGGFEVFTDWLRTQLHSHGANDAVASTSRAMRREADHLRDTTMVQLRLLHREDAHADATMTELNAILDRADERVQSALDQIRGEATRLRRHLDQTHENAVTDALEASAHLLTTADTRSPELSPEAWVEHLRGDVAEEIRTRARDWYQRTGAELETGMQRVLHRAQGSLATELSQARQAVGDLLRIELSVTAELAVPEPPRPPSFDTSVHPGWEELVSAVLKRYLPARLRRRRALREVQRWRELAVPRPFGRARSTLQNSLREMTNAAQQLLERMRVEQTTALRNGLDAVRDAHNEPEHIRVLEQATRRRAVLDEIITMLT